MNSKICELLDIEFPLVAFTHCRDVVVAVSKAGGCGVLGAVGMTPEELEEELKWIDDHIDGLPYGVDVLIPNKMADQDKSSNLRRSSQVNLSLQNQPRSLQCRQMPITRRHYNQRVALR